MRHGVSNFDRDIFPDNPSFRTIQAHQLRGRTRVEHEWMGMTWMPRYHTTGGRAPLLEVSRHENHTTRPTIFGQVFEPLEREDKIKRYKDKWEIRLTSPVFIGAAETKVQVKAGKLFVVARSSRERNGRNGLHGWSGNSFEYQSVLPPGFKAKEISAKRDGSTMLITIPFTPSCA
ncbi:hypothetical protein COEREDRAFT_81390 [Coemansia reversa NRRL 1564]|uniref:SHSP domain-containing protein n=1 Tax=Coemansia reversa (strain ATCC 12441 / NRRL 1564) TaxID=763665 RepID=A0A2G5BAX7_COERN|nr:hypothetical protein COEREDRAFT_81390 [Coemansia reversa NRRL 1564]|eukprot:PIA16168.1 hypothetical protein COEREDRAFT_81390 [Coemansia reversa NRRL 1564]